MKLKKLFKETKDEMDALSKHLSRDSQMIDELTTNVIDEDRLRGCAASLTAQHYDSLKRSMERSEAVMSLWLGLPVEPSDPYKEGNVHCSKMRLP